MDTNKLKRFATEARNILMQGVAQRLSALGFDLRTGEPAEIPQEVGGGAVFMGDTVSTEFYTRWMSLHSAIEHRSIREVAEEAAYTWFNRLVAIRIMSKQNFIEPVLAYESEDIHVPVIVSDARQGRLPQLSEALYDRLNVLLNDDSKTNEQFALLIVAYCHQNPIINRCFGAISDYTEMLLPQNILADGGFIDMLNHTEFISDEDYASPELIGWLYQFYNAERKDEVFAKKGKYVAEDIAPATQIFTPNWIVKYMVENTVGRIYLDNDPYSELKEQMKYLVEPEEPTPDEAKFHFDDIHELTCADLSCGSGHILNECFDLLYQCYLESGYSRRKAVEDIFRYNLTGVDLDTRAKQLAQFALLIKACQKDNTFLNAEVMPRVYDMPRPYGEYFESENALRGALTSFIMGDDATVVNELVDAITLMDDAENLGSIMIFNISDRTRNIIATRLSEYESQSYIPSEIGKLMPYMRIILTLTQKFAAIVMNPPYMGNNKMGDSLKDYVDNYFVSASNDLCTVFMCLAESHIKNGGKYSMINQAAWMFKPVYTIFRQELLDNNKCTFDSVLYFGPGIFEELKGERVQSVAFTTSKSERKATIFAYLKGISNRQRIESMVNQTYKKYSCDITTFKAFPKFQFGFWINSSVIKELGNSSIQEFGDAKQGLKTGDNTKFMRLWYEVSALKIKHKWFLVENGGNFRKWYGNTISVINWENNGYEIKNFKDENGRLRSRPQGLDFAFKEGLTWSTSASERQSFRFSDSRVLFESSGSKFCFINEADNELLPKVCAFFNSPVTRNLLEVFSPGLGISEGAVKSLPYLNIDDKYNTCAYQSIRISKQDWDSHETSWDFAKNELMAVDSQTYKDNINYAIEKHLKETGEEIDIDPAAPQLDSLEWRMEQYKLKWERLFMQLHANEEELNRQFIDIYGLQDELTPDVPLDEVTILQQGEVKITNQYELADNDGAVFVDGDGAVLTVSGDTYLDWQEDVIIKQLISYAVGCMMGRYRLDRPGLAIAHPDATADEIAPYEYNCGKFEIDDDGIVPLMPANCEFTDNANLRFKYWLELAFSSDSLVENLNFVEKCLGKPIDEYFVKDFWKDHKKMYQNRPIYWMFASKKGAFQCIVYLHRMNAYTAERIRTNYLLPHIEWLVQKQQELQNNAANLTTAERRELDSLTKQIDECREYHDRLHVIADKQIAFDLDDGVIVNHAKFGDVLTKLK